ETRMAVEKARKELQELEVSSAEEKRKLTEEVDALKAAMAPVANEHVAAQGLVTRAELVNKISILAKYILEGSKY
ncbi:hypothetical protein A2U01_0101769, partial [Trifolium medium]|nr:hypothetical protein [Trifolium medium]